MKRLILLIVAVAFAACAANSGGNDDAKKDEKEKPMQLTAADNGKTVKIAVGKLFDVALEGNPTTGFQWQAESIKGESVRQNGKVEYVQKKHPPKMVGVGGTFIFHFEVVKAGKTKIRLVYVRPWEKDKKPEKTFAVTIESE